jgi:hypothetical protein
MEINYKLYGVFLFIIILVLIYLLNRNVSKYNNVIEKINEGFGNEEDTDVDNVEDNYKELDNVYFDLTKLIKLQTPLTLNGILKKCNSDKKCKGITILKNESTSENVSLPENETYNKYYLIIDTKSSYSLLQGSGEQRYVATNYKTYLKKTVPGSEKLVLSDDTIESQFFTIRCKGNMLMGVKNNQLCGINKYTVQIDQLYDNIKIKIVNGLYGDGNISIKLYNNNVNDNMYITHNYPSNRKLILKKITESDGDEIKKKATFRVVSGLLKEGFTIKILEYDNMYIKLSGNNNKIDYMTIDKILNDNDISIKDLVELKNSATFYFNPDIEVITTPNSNINELNDKITEVNDNIDSNENEEVSVSTITQEEKIRRLKNKNINSLDRQSLLLENQNKKIKDMELLHFSNIGKVSREFANQSAKLALAKYIKEKDDIELLNSKTISPGDNMPSVQSFKSL